MNWQYCNPVRIIFTDVFHDVLAGLVADNQKALVICSPRFHHSTAFVRLNNSMTAFECFSFLENNPSFESCQKAIDFARRVGPDVIIGIGGGSVIDTAKAARMALYRSCRKADKLSEHPGKLAKNPAFIAVPTTHGSGSELTMWATIWDKTAKAKRSLEDPANYPDYAVYDVALFASLPADVSVSSTLDALCHAWEALWNKNANPISSEFAIEAIRRIATDLDKLEEPVSLQTRENLVLASMYAGLAFSNTRTAAAHSISYPLTAHFGIPHGIACSMPLRPLAQINLPHIEDDVQRVLCKCAVSSIDELWDLMERSTQGTVPFSLHKYGVSREDLGMLAEQGFSRGRMENNIADLSHEDVLNILKDIY